MTTRSLMGAMLMTAALVGCSGDDDIAEPRYTTSLAPATTSTAVQSTTSLPSTTAVATTMLPTTPPATALNTVAPTAPPTTLDPDAALAEAVARDWKESMRLLNEALMDPNNAERTAAALAYTAEPFTDTRARFISGYRDLGQRILPEPLMEPTLTVEAGPEPVIDTFDEVDITVCEVDSWVRVEAGAGPEGTDAVVDDIVYTHRYDVRLRLVDGVWKTVRNSVGTTWEGVSECGA